MRMHPGFIKVNYCFVVFSVLFQSQQIFVPHFNYPWLLVIVTLILPFCIFEAHFFQKPYEAPFSVTMANIPCILVCIIIVYLP